MGYRGKKITHLIAMNKRILSKDIPALRCKIFWEMAVMARCMNLKKEIEK